MKTVIAALGLMFGMTLHAFPALAQSAQDTASNRETVAAAVVDLLSPLSVTPEMVEQADLCHVQIKRPGFDFSRSYDLTLLDDVAAMGHGFTGSLNASEIDIWLGANAQKTEARHFTCKISGGGSSCDVAFIIGGASWAQFARSHQAAADIVQICNPAAAYKACPSGQFNGNKCL